MCAAHNSVDGLRLVPHCHSFGEVNVVAVPRVKPVNLQQLSDYE